MRERGRRSQHFKMHVSKTGLWVASRIICGVIGQDCSLSSLPTRRESLESRPFPLKEGTPWGLTWQSYQISHIRTATLKWLPRRQHFLFLFFLMVMFAILMFKMVPCRHWELKEFFLVVISARDNIQLPLILVTKTKKNWQFWTLRRYFYNSILKTQMMYYLN